MKNIITTGLLLLILTIGYTQTKRHTETVKKEIIFEKSSTDNVFYLANINGNIAVEGYDGKSVQIEMVKTITAKSESRLQAAKDEISLGVIDRLDTIIVYMKGECGTFSNHNNKWKNENKSWNYNWNNYENEYDFKLDFKVKVPYNLNIYVSTINDGDIAIQKVTANIGAHNINGSISLNDIEGEVFANTINGDVTLNFNKNPTIDSRYYALNGDINANFKPGLSADMSFKSFNGEFYSNINSIEYMPTKIEKKTANQDGVNYKLNGKSMLRVGKGGVYLDFETFNGDVYVKEI